DLGLVTVSASKYEKKFGEESVSVEVLTPEFIQNTNAVTLDKAVEKVPGVNFVGETMNIRGGAGYSANAGSRVLMLLDGVPWLTPQNSGIQFWALPMESVKQVEIIKGASSTLYGSSALNGTMNLITENPRSEPYSKIQLFYGLYENPLKGRRKEFYWSDRLQMFHGAAFAHRRKVNGKFDFAVNGAFNHDDSYLISDTKTRQRFFFKTRYRPKENITIGINGNFAYLYGGFYFLWADYDTTPRGDSLAYVTDSTGTYREFPFNIDPHITVFDKKGNKHQIKGRYYYIMTRTTEGEDTDAGLSYGEYTFHSSIKSLGLDFVAGLSGTHSIIDSKIFEKRKSSNGAVFLQIDKKIADKVTLTGGGRLEVFQLDTLDMELQPIGRAGVNYRLAKKSYLRGSFGTGYRYPSIAEKFVKTVRSGQYVVPNFGLTPESSWSAELGFKQEFQISQWVGYLDVAGYISQYYDMMEFTIAPDSVTRKYYPDAFFAFWSENVTDSRISGFEISALGQGKIFNIITNFLIGYTYMSPIDLNYNPEEPKYQNRSNILNFRFRHSAKADIECAYKGVTFGATASISSFIENIDPLLNLIPGVANWRKYHEEPSYFIDARIGYNFTENMRALFIAKNITNNQYSIRPGFIEAPRNYTLQLSYKF
ncbi:MAG TPA: TonB-dependent receptor, partial [Chitinophagales bacterium]|nr:TonB-dependent receptor [Chitinophagales bacterium]